MTAVTATAGSSGVRGEQVFALPDLGEGLTEAEIVQWRVGVGDVIGVDDVVVEVETAKAIVDVPCPYAGRVLALHGTPGELRPVGQPLITVAPVVVTQPALPGSPESSASSAGHAESAASAVSTMESDGGSGNVLVGYGTGTGPAARRRRHRLAAAPTVTTAAAAPVVALVISPLVRRAARDAGVDVTAVRGTGPGGVIRRADVQDAIAHRVSPVPSGSAGAVAGSDRGAPMSSLPGGDVDGVVIPLRGVRRVIADRLARSRREIPEVTVWVDVDATELLATRAAINAAQPDRPVGILALLARICVSGLRRFPALNSRVEADRIVQSRRIHLGVATSTARGLLVPVIFDAHLMSTMDISARLVEVTTAAREGTLTAPALTGGTFTLNNYGVFGVDGSTPIINQPEAALLGIGRIVDKPWVVDGQLAVRKVTQIGLTFDHRVCDGEVAGGFLRHVADCVQTPALLIAHT